MQDLDLIASRNVSEQFRCSVASMSRFRGSADSTYKSLAGKRVLITGMGSCILWPS